MKKFFILVLVIIANVQSGAFAKTAIIDNRETVYFTSDNEYSEKGNWSDWEYNSYETKIPRVTNRAGSKAVWTSSPSKIGKYELYFWKAVANGGDPEMKISVATSMDLIEKNIDCSSGYSGWERIGVLNMADVFITVTVEASGKGILPICAIKYVQTDDEEYEANRIFKENKNLLIIKKDSSKALYDNKYLEIGDTKPCIINNSMMVPIRFICDSLNADILWDEDRTVSIKKDDKEIVFTIDSDECYVNGQMNKLVQPAVIDNSRTMVPLRAVSELMGYEVIWDDRGLVLIGSDIIIEEKDRETIMQALSVVLS